MQVSTKTVGKHRDEDRDHEGYSAIIKLMYGNSSRNPSKPSLSKRFYHTHEVVHPPEDAQSQPLTLYQLVE